MERVELACTTPGAPPRLEIHRRDLRLPGPGQVLVRIFATSVNPIDAKRAAGYGRRLLSLKGAGRFPLVLGNDLAGRVEAVGEGVTRFTLGQAVYGLLATGRGGGAHATHALVPESQLLAAEGCFAASTLAVLPYSFTTVWLSLRALGLTPASADQAHVLIHGASGGLGRLATQLLKSWGSSVTTICGRGQRQLGFELGAAHSVERGPRCIEGLPDDFDAVLNYASWDDDALLATRLGPQAFGQATTVHPLLGNFDRLRWFGGAWASRRDWRAASARVKARAPAARYAWTVFKPDRQALEALALNLRDGRLSLPVGIAKPFDEACAVFNHVTTGQPGRAVLLP
ncbi:MAG: alcohol dehydrogenase catalytic domain-containing protein [Paucibacter sp.]|nr:alcohol dehydrogenase catalytic domain-containing protein [Roseateles sp.]